MTNIIPELIKQNWNSRGYSFGVFRDPPGQVWADFVHKTDELVVLAEGEIEVLIEGKVERPKIGEEVFIPANVVHTVRNDEQTKTFGITDIKIYFLIIIFLVREICEVLLAEERGVRRRWSPAQQSLVFSRISQGTIRIP